MPPPYDRGHKPMLRSVRLSVPFSDFVPFARWRTGGIGALPLQMHSIEGSTVGYARESGELDDCSEVMLSRVGVCVCGCYSVCRSCIVRYLESSQTCPVCDVPLHENSPLLGIRSTAIRCIINLPPV